MRIVAIGVLVLVGAAAVVSVRTGVRPEARRGHQGARSPVAAAVTSRRTFLASTTLPGPLVQRAARGALQGGGLGGPERVLIPEVIEENRGQFGKEAQYGARGDGYIVGFVRGGLALLPASRARASPRRPDIGIQFVGSRETRWRGEQGLAGRANYFLGRERREWKTGVPLYSSVRAAEVYPGIDCVTRINEPGRRRGEDIGSARDGPGGAGPEFDFAVAPGAEVRRIRLNFAGAERLELNGAGDLVVRSGEDEMRLKKPVMYQPVDAHEGRRGREVRDARDVRDAHSVPGAMGRSLVIGGYVLERGGMVAFRVGKYDHARPLIIDPSISVSYTTFLGGAGADAAMGVAVANGKVYVSGTTTAANFSGLSGIAQGPGGQSDFFVAELDTTKSGAASLVYLTFIGGSGVETGGRLVVNAAGQVALVGTTTSTDYPVTDGSRRTSGSNDLAISLLSATGAGLEFSTLLGGSGAEVTHGTPAAAFDPSGNVVAAFNTTSVDLPVTAGAFSTTFGGGDSDGVVAIYSPTGTLSYLSYGGINAEVAVTGVAIDLLGHVYVTGYMSRPVASSFPATNAFQNLYAGGPSDGYIFCLMPKGLGASDLIFATYFGGGGADEPLAVAVDGAIPANVYIAGLTESPDLPANPSRAGFQATLAGPINGFVAAIGQTAAGVTSLKYTSYLGGSTNDSLQAISVLSPQAVYVTGLAASANFPVFNTLQPFSGTSDGVLAKFDTTQSGSASLVYSTFLAGRNNAQANAVAATVAGNIFVAGNTNSPDFPLAGNPQNGAQPVCASCTATPATADAFVAEVMETAAAAPVVTFNANQLNFGNQLVGTPNPPQAAVILNSGAAPLAIHGVGIVGANALDYSLSESECPVAPNLLEPGGECSLTVTFSPSLPTTETAAISVTDNASGSPQSLDLTGKGEEPLASLSATVLAFGSVPVGDVNATQSVTLTNAGDALLTISQILIAGPNQVEFPPRGQNTCTGGPIAAGGTCTVNIAFQPDSTGVFTATLEIFDNQGNDPSAMQSVPLTGTGISASPIASVVPASIAFGFQIFGTQSGPQPVTVVNTGTLPMQIGGFAIAGAQAGDFVMGAGSTCPMAGGTLNVGAGCQLNLVFAPSATGSRTATVSVADNAPGSPQVVNLSGVGTSASLTVNSTALEFAPQSLGMASAQQSATIRNSGTGSIQITGISVAGTNPGDFPVTNNCPLTINSGVACRIDAAFTPTAGGARSAAIFVADNAPGSPQVIALSGTGLTPGVQLGTSTETFTPELVGMTSGAKGVTLQNAGDGDLAIASMTLTGSGASDFSASNNCGKMLAPRAECQIRIKFAPTLPSNRSAALQIVDNAIGSPQFINLSGVGTNFEIAAPKTGGQAATVKAGNTATYSLNVVPQGGFTGTVALGCKGAPAESSCTVQPTSVTLDGSALAPLTVSVTTASALSPVGGLRKRSVRDTPQFTGVAALSIGLLLMTLFSLRDIAKRGGYEQRVRSAIWADLKGRPALSTLAFCMLFGVLVGLSACGSGASVASNAPGGSTQTTNPTPTPAGNYSLTVTGTSSGISRAATLSLTVQ